MNIIPRLDFAKLSKNVTKLCFLRETSRTMNPLTMDLFSIN